MLIIHTSDYNIDNTGNTLVTKKLQELIDLASKRNATLCIDKGIYLVSNLFLKSNMTLLFDSATLLATTIETEYIVDKTRVAGIEMEWYLGVINVINCKNVNIIGDGTVNGNGEYWWKKYWGSDMLGGMREYYDKNGIRFLCDYDCKRIRNVLISNSSNIRINDIRSYNSGFWNIHILYSNDVIVDNIYVDSKGINSPSTDGLDIDSSNNIIIKNSIFECNDDNISIKSGRDSDGLRVNIPSFNITIKDCIMKSGFGITMGSEVSGGIYDINISNIKFFGSDCGIRMKSSKARKGYIKNIRCNNLYMENVKYLFHFYLDWNREYNNCVIPAGYKGVIYDYYKILTTKANPNISNTRVSNIFINNVKAINTDDYYGISRVFNIEGYDDCYMSNIIFDNMDIRANEYGFIKNVDNLQINNSNIIYNIKKDNMNDEFDNR